MDQHHSGPPLPSPQPSCPCGVDSAIEMELDCKSKLWYLGPMVVVRRMERGAYIMVL
jgi:hypothetical protein